MNAAMAFLIFALVMVIADSAFAYDVGLMRGVQMAGSCAELDSSWAPNWSTLEGYWPLNCAVGTNATGASYGDFSSKNNTGTAGSAITCSASRNEQFVTFNGSNQYISIPATAGTRPTATVSMSAWMKFGAFGVVTSPIGNFQSGGYGFDFEDSGTSLAFSIAVGGTYKFAKYSTSNMTTNTWYHLVGTYDGAALKLYVNGALVSTTAQTGAISYTYSNGLCVGVDAAASGCDTAATFFNGSVDDLAVWSSALTAAQVKSLYMRQNCNDAYLPEVDSLIGLYRLDEAVPGIAATTFADSSPAGQTLTGNGTIYGADGKQSFSAVLTSDTTYIYKNSPTGMPTTGNKTIATWFKFASTTYCKTALCNFGGFGNPLMNGQNFQVGTGADGIFVVWGWGGGTWDWATGVSTTPFIDGNWHHVALTYATGSPNTTKLYVDGVLKATTTAYTYAPNPQFIVLGNEIDKSGQNFPGRLDEFGIWSTTLSATDVLRLYQSSWPLRTK